MAQSWWWDSQIAIKKKKTLQNLISNLGQKFSVIAVSETRNPNSDKSGNKPQALEGYQNYHGQHHGVKGKSLKSWCRF